VNALVFIAVLLQAAPPPRTAPQITTASVRGDKFQILVPQGWKTLNDGGFVLLGHTSGASVLFQRASRAGSLSDFAQRQAERVMLPLGFATIGQPTSFKDTREEWIQYDIRGKRLTDDRRILYRLLRRDTNYFEFIYEASEEGFKMLLTEAQEIASSVQAIIEKPTVRRRR